METSKHHLPFARINVIVIALCIVSLIPLFVIGMYDRPSADDFSYSLQTHEAFLASGGNPLAVLGAAVSTDVDFYNNWQGLYTSAFLLALQPGIAGGASYPIGCWLIMAFVIGACLFLACRIERYAFKSGTALWPAAGFAAATLFLQCMPSANEGIFWYNGAANYTPVFFATFFTIGMCLKALEADRPRQRACAAVGAAVVSFIVSGGNYMPAFFNLMVMASFAGIGLLRKRPALLAPLAASVVGFAISAMAPGTAIRQNALNELFGHPSVIGTIAHSVYQAIMDLRLFIDLPTLVFLAALTPFVVAWSRRSPARFSWKTLGIAAAVAFVFMVGTLCVPYYAIGDFGEGRARNIAYFVDVFLVAGLYGYAVCCIVARKAQETGGESANRQLSTGAYTAIAAVAIAAVALYGSQVVGHGNAFIAARSLANGEAAAYAAEFDAREATLLESAGDDATIRLISTRPDPLFFSDVERNGQDWSSAFIDYYKLKSLNVEDRENAGE